MSTDDSTNVINKIYGSYGEALALCNGVGYSMHELTEVVVKKNIALKKSIKRDSFLGSEATRTLLGIGFALNSKSLRVLDFGGGGGYHYTLARHALGDGCQIKWNIIETESMCQAGLAIANDHLKFFRDTASAADDLGYVDLIFSSSSLQYCPDPIGSLKELLAVSAKYIYITRTPFLNGEDTLVSIQGSMLSHNGPGPLPDGYVDQEILYPISFVPINHVEALIKDKYNIRFKVLEDAANLFVEGKPVNTYYGIFCELK